jgi:hypothetical protein
LEEDEMGAGGWDSGRRWAALVGAVFQVGATVLAGTAISEVVSEGPPSPVEPAGYAFGVWAVIFFLSLLFAGYQALPANRGSEVLRRVGWPVVGAFACTGLWSVFVSLRQLGFAQAMLLAVFAFLLVAYLRLARSDPGALGRAERWLVSLTVGIFLGWVTAANAVSLASEAVRRGLVDAGGSGEVLVGAVLLISGGLLAAAITEAGRAGPPQAYAAFALTVLWALLAVVVAQYDASLVTAVAAVVAALPVLAVLLRGGRARSRVRGANRPRVA